MDEIIWDENGSSITYFGDFYVDIDAPISIGDEVRLQYEGYEFDVAVEEIAGGVFSGSVIRIGPRPSIEEEGISRGDYVSFYQEHVFQVNRS